MIAFAELRQRPVVIPARNDGIALLRRGVAAYDRVTPCRQRRPPVR
jgi:hypothetical protein